MENKTIKAATASRLWNAFITAVNHTLGTQTSSFQVPDPHHVSSRGRAGKPSCPGKLNMCNNMYLNVDYKNKAEADLERLNH